MAAAEQDHYAVLGVPPHATDAQVRSAYLALLKRVHPDVGGSATAFHAVTRAYAVLGDPDARVAYDLARTPRPAPQGSPGGQPSQSRRAAPTRTWATDDPATWDFSDPEFLAWFATHAQQRPVPASPPGPVTRAVVAVLRGGRRLRQRAIGSVVVPARRYLSLQDRLGLRPAGDHPFGWTIAAALVGATWWLLHADGAAARLAGPASPPVVARTITWWTRSPKLLPVAVGFIVALAWQTWIPWLRRMPARWRQRVWVRTVIAGPHAALIWVGHWSSPRILGLLLATTALGVAATTPWLELLGQMWRRGIRAIARGSGSLVVRWSRRLAAWWAEVRARASAD